MFLMPAAEIELSFKQYPVDIPILSGTGAENEIALWNGIVGHEIFPATESPDSYRLTLKKSANVVEDVSTIDKELENALVDLSHVWEFAGGTTLILHETLRKENLHYVSNAKERKRELLRARGNKGWSHSFTLSWDLVGTYRCMPLEPARRLCLEVASNVYLKKMLKYYHNGVADQEKWFIHLYKVREVLKEVFGSALDVRSMLKIEKKEWNEFGDILNNRYDLRHFKMNASSGEVPKQEKVKTIQIAREWITKYLRYLGMRPT